jgi:hypothetical protein
VVCPRLLPSSSRAILTTIQFGTFSFLIREKVRPDFESGSLIEVLTSVLAIHQRSRGRNGFRSDYGTLRRGRVQPTWLGGRYQYNHAGGDEGGVGHWPLRYRSRVAGVIHEEASPRISCARCPYHGHWVARCCWCACSASLQLFQRFSLHSFRIYVASLSASKFSILPGYSRLSYSNRPGDLRRHRWQVFPDSGLSPSCLGIHYSRALGNGKYALEHVQSTLRHIISAEAAANDGLAYPFLNLTIFLTINASKGEAFKRWILDGCLCKFPSFYFTISFESTHPLVCRPSHSWHYVRRRVGCVHECLVIQVVFVSEDSVGYGFRKLLTFSHNKGLAEHHSFVIQYLALALFTGGVASALGMDDLLAAFAAGMPERSLTVINLSRFH